MNGRPEARQGGRPFSGVLDVRRGELFPLLTSALLFFSILCSIKIVKAMRETVSTIAGLERIPDLWTYTFVFTVVANLLYWSLVNRVPRRRFVPWSLHFCATCLLIFWALLHGTSGTLQEWVGYGFYTWYSAFNLCVVSLFWVCMVDQFTTEQGRRLFGLIAIGGTLGGILGSKLAEWLVGSVGEAGLFLLAAGAIEIAVVANALRERLAGDSRAPDRNVVAGGGVFEGLGLVLRTRTLAWFAVLIVLMTAAQGGFYFLQLDFVREHLPRADRTVYYAQKEALADTLTLLLEVFVTARAVRWLGVGITLSIVPVLAIAGIFVVLSSPELGLVLIVHALWDSGRHGLVRPAREIVFTKLGAAAKYKSKTFLDAFLYRGSDVAWSWFFGMFRGATVPWVTIAWVTIPFAAAWGIVGPVLGWSHKRDRGVGAS
ncbi:MAG: hypothetical protein KDB80_14920 [Planctomycetes bacterium]|nr:hypothetical protein [Planctomycetota bacterium]